MSSREPMWFCHECHSEMRPLMVPDPTCASCHGSFVEKMENPADDPREFRHHGGQDGLPPGMDNFFLTLQGLMDRGISEGRSPTPRSPEGTGPGGFTFQVRSSAGGPRTVTIGGPGSLGARPRPTGVSREAPTMSEFLRRGPDATDGPGITGPMMAQYLMALLGQRDPLNEMFARGMGDNAAEHGRFGDYVFNQEALDQIITQLMENSNSSRPVAATEEIIEKLPREVLEYGSPTLEKDCAVCKDQFKLETDDPDEQVVVTLPCKHPFHEPCILPWLKSSGTCPVCRYALVPQPEHHSPAGPGPGSDQPGSPSSRSRSPRPRSPDRGGSADSSGLFQSLFGGYMGTGSGNSTSGAGSGGSSRQRRTTSDATGRRTDRSGGSGNHIPGSWSEDLD